MMNCQESHRTRRLREKFLISLSMGPKQSHKGVESISVRAELANSSPPYSKEEITNFQDGSFVRKFSKDTNTQMGFAWAEISDCYTDNVPPIIFQGATAFNLSSTMCPNDSEITFYTDSQNVIDTYQKISNKLTSIQKILKNSNNIAWRLIDHIIIDKNLSVTFFKVNAHSGNQFKI
ncbi:hypothetical protein RhiirA4_429639 [Rhizophagus irregularis]|uniref:RNase H type-1 domain-containing protein n=1 Tax=Rhizophagus irregularis TaxID=588596 RepID=A0A2I1HHI3_9GLOM|nr:hypothetical protein RhiirA4_429639 [Rhizophagus irregularis]